MYVQDEWDKFWPEWMPKKLKAHLEDFLKFQGKSPDMYLSDSIKSQKGYGTDYSFGQVVTYGKGEKNYTGRFVHDWNNMCRLVFDDGSYKVFSFHDKPYDREYFKQKKERLEQQRTQILRDIGECERAIATDN